MPSFSNKKTLKFVITLGSGKFGSSENDVIVLQGFRATVDIDKAGGVQMSTLRARIYGVKQADMNSATTLQWKPNLYTPNTVEVYAIDGDVETLVFAGNIVNAWGDYQSIPDVHFHIQAQAAYFDQLRSVKPLSIKGGIDVAVVMERIAKDMGLAFENNNVHVFLSDVYVASSLTEQAKELAHACNFALYIDDKVLAITNRYEPRKGSIPQVSPQSGLVGYPTFDGIGVSFQTLFNPSIIFGGLVELVTDLPQAAGQWIVVSMSYRLESEKPGGAWVANIRGNVNGLAVLK